MNTTDTWTLVMVIRHKTSGATQRYPGDHETEEAARAEYALRKGNVSSWSAAGAGWELRSAFITPPSGDEDIVLFSYSEETQG